jgi:flagellar motor switch protein FliM
MADDVLSKNEVENLLTTLSDETPTPSNPATAVSASRRPVSRSREKVNPYDFKRPERVGKEQMRALQSLHEGFGRNFGASLSAMLRTIVDVKLTSVDQLTYSEFVFSLDTPTCFNLVRADPLEGYLILDIHPSVLFPIVDRLLGGGKEPQQAARRPLTEIELRLVSRVTDKFLEELKAAWEIVVELDLGIERVENNPHLVQIVPPNEVVVLISFELTLGETRGMLNLCIPFNSIERIGNTLASNSWSSYRRVASSDATRAMIAERLNEAEVELIVTLARTKISTGDLVELRVGDIITTDHDVKTPLEVAVEGMDKFTASPGAWKGRKAVEIQSSQVNG